MYVHYVMYLSRLIWNLSQNTHLNLEDEKLYFNPKFPKLMFIGLLCNVIDFGRVSWFWM